MARSLYPYVDWVGASLRGVKYEGERDRAAFVGAMLAQDRSTRQLLATAHHVVPVPVHRRRQNQRGYNQARLLAEAACEAIGHEAPIDLLRRAGENPSQVQLSGDERRQNVRGAFALAGDVEISLGSRIVILDDVRTTGSTISACAEGLRPVKPSRIDVITVAVELWPDVMKHLGIAMS